jgi:hypothetical protein
MLGPVPFSTFIALLMCFNVVRSKKSQIVIGLKFIENLIFAVKKYLNFFLRKEKCPKKTWQAKYQPS